MLNCEGEASAVIGARNRMMRPIGREIECIFIFYCAAPPTIDAGQRRLRGGGAPAIFSPPGSAPGRARRAGAMDRQPDLP